MKKVIYTENAPKAIGPYSQAIENNNLIFISGQLGIDPKSGNLVNGGVEFEAEQSMKNIRAILEELNLNFSNIIKTTIFLTNIKDFSIVNEIYGKYFIGNFPARSTIQVTGLPKGGLVEVEVIVSRF